MSAAIIRAAREFQKDEQRRHSRGQQLRMPGSARGELADAVAAAVATDERSIDSPIWREQRGRLAVGVFGYTDTIDENAATVITDILHAVAAAGFSPQAVLNQAAAYYAEELPKPTDGYALAR
jgi:hypothetical protein